MPNTMLPDVSIIIPTYNRKRMVREAVASCLHCSDIPIEVIVVDDGSTDGTDALLRSSFQDPRLRFVRISHGGAPRARNVGIRHARGQSLWFLDSDDLLIDQSLKQIFNIMQQSNCDIVITPFISLDLHDGTKKIMQYNVCRWIQEEKPANLFSVFTHCNRKEGNGIHLGNTVLYRRSFIRRCSLWCDEGLPFYQDHIFLLSCAVQAPPVAAFFSPSFICRQHNITPRILNNYNNTPLHIHASILYPRYRKAEETAHHNKLLNAEGRKWFALYYSTLAKYTAHNPDLYRFYLKEVFRIYPEYKPKTATKRILWSLFGPRNSDLLVQTARRITEKLKQ